MYLTSHLKAVFIIACFFIINTSKAQSKQTDTLNKFTGTWGGSSIDVSKRKYEHVSYVTWRIHDIDNVKNQIVVTEINQKVYTGNKIKDPKKMIYKGKVDGDSLLVEVRNPDTKKKYLVKLKFDGSGEVNVLKGSVESEENKHNFVFSMIKSNDDTSTYVKPTGDFQIIVTPPPPKN
ncbi:hypothetical protein HQN86_19280 [Pedobacter panaciterrae]|jgi:hypothetical protein|uniref:hypothetical protein n=1 Tax=Pedobacter panaciterrae TaxID=363849 RepID=UPI00155D875B|nr:hypothetical protein [Pedobacter panaciterrae]NQX55773.1 hypothetical protein [Pedobacter panaciterrae]